MRDVAVERDELVPGRWNLSLDYVRGLPHEVRFDFQATVHYGAAEGATLDVAAPPVWLDEYEGVTVPFRLVGVERGAFPLDVKVRAVTHHDHATNAGYDWDNYSRYRTVNVVVGDAFTSAEGLAAFVPTAAADPSRAVGETLGLASAALLPPALLLGGGLGRGSRRALNVVLGGAKRRVMFHNAISLGLSLVALAHVVLFLLEARYHVLVGFLWGGLGLVALLLLALTGYYQVPLIQKYGFPRWRVLHLALGVLVVVFVAWHAVVDGADFDALRQRLPDVLTRWNLAAP